MPFPTPTIPGQVTTFVTPNGDRNGIHHPGDTIEIEQTRQIIDQDLIAGRTYEVRDYRGNIVDSGSIPGTDATIALNAPAGGWPCGWYRYYLRGPTTPRPNTDFSIYGDAYGAFNFVVVPENTEFPDNVSFAVWESQPHGGEVRDPFLKGVLGMGTSRLQIGDTLDIHAGLDTIESCVDDANNFMNYYRFDAARPRPLMCQFPNGTVTYGILNSRSEPNTGSDYLHIYPLDGLDPDLIYFSGDVGTLGGDTSKVSIYYPDAGTLVEEYDNLGADSSAAAIITAASSYVAAVEWGAIDGCEVTAPTQIGGARQQAVTEVVGTLYPLGVTDYEGPSNEPRITGGQWARQVTIEQRLFRQAVHAGHPDARANGPAVVSIVPADLTDYAVAGGFDYVDSISIHAYGAQTGGDFNEGRYNIKQFKDFLASYDAGYENLPLWITESTNVFTSVAGNYHPQRARVIPLNTMLWEQWGVPHELNQIWYDTSHGFWGYPSWIINIDGSLNPYAPMYRTMANEIYGKTFHHAIDFGSVQGNRVFLGNVYTSTSDESTVMFVAQSFIEGATVEFQVHGTEDDIVAVDAWGNETVCSQSAGRIVVDAAEIPTYLRLPENVHVSVYACLDWGHGPPPTISPRAAGLLSGDDKPILGDNGYLLNYGGEEGVALSLVDPPDTADLMFNGELDVGHVIVWCNSPYQPYSALVDFEIQTWDGATWTTRETVTKQGVESFVFPTCSLNAGCTYETYWDEQWIFNLDLGGTVTCQGVRVYATQTSYGGSPDLPPVAAGLEQGSSVQRVTVQEIAVPSLSAPDLWTIPYSEEVAADSPLGWWRCGEPSGATVAADSSGNGYDGVYLNNPLLGVDGPIADANSAMGPVYATHSCLKIPNNTGLNVGDVFTIELWCRTLGGAQHDYVLGKGFGGPRADFTEDNFGLRKGSVTTSRVAYSSVDLPDTGWHHYVITKDGADTKIYIDAVDVTVLDTNQTFTDNSSDLFFGATDTIDILQSGSVDELAWYGTALTAERVEAHFRAAGTPNAVPRLLEDPVLA